MIGAWLHVPVSLVLAAIVGFAAHRASVCTVRAVAEVLGSHRGHMLASFAKTALWVLATSVPLLWILPGAAAMAQGHPLTLTSVAGGFVFGVGAAVNGGCAFSTLTRLADGNLRMLYTLAGFIAGAGACVALNIALPRAADMALSTPVATPRGWSLGLVAALWLAAAWELVRLWRTRDRAQGWWARCAALRYRLSTAAALIGICGGLLYSLNGSWAYTSALKSMVESWAGVGAGPTVLQGTLLAAVLGGMALSAWQRRRQGIGAGPPGSVAGHAAGGALMGLGGVLIPGGNDSLLLQAIPLLSPHAVPAYAGVLAGVAATLVLMQFAGATPPRLTCRGDVCREE